MFYSLLMIAFSPFIVFFTSVFFFSTDIAAGDETAERKDKDSKHVVVSASPDQKPQGVKDEEVEEGDGDYFKDFELAQNLEVCRAGEVCLW